MTRCGGIVYEAGHSHECAGKPEVIGKYRYEGYAVTRHYDIVMCPLCQWHHLTVQPNSQVTRPHPIKGDVVRKLQAVAHAERDTTIEAARVRFQQREVRP